MKLGGKDKVPVIEARRWDMKKGRAKSKTGCLFTPEAPSTSRKLAGLISLKLAHFFPQIEIALPGGKNQSRIEKEFMTKRE